MKNTNPYRERKWYQIGPGAIIMLILVFIIPIPFINAMYERKIFNIMVLYTGVYIYFVGIIIHFIRSNRVNQYHIVDQKIVKNTIKTLRTDRIAQTDDFVSRELNALGQGLKIPVLDLWKTDSQLHAQHSYFSRLQHIVIDPQKKEMELLIQLPMITLPGPSEIQAFRVQFMHRIMEFMKTAAAEPHLSRYQPFIATLFIECDALREDEREYDVQYPIFSMALAAEHLPRIASALPYQEIPFQRIADIRFADGAEVTPHRKMTP